MIPQVGGFQGCYLDNHRNNWRCARAVPALCENAPIEYSSIPPTLHNIRQCAVYVATLPCALLSLMLSPFAEVPLRPNQVFMHVSTQSSTHAHVYAAA